jgi:hypothetical protein
MSAVYEKARAEGYPKARAAKIGWGAVKRAGYDMDEVYGYDPAFVPRRSRILGGARRAVRSGQRLRGRLSSLRSPRLTRQPRQPKRTTTPSPTRRPSYIADPAKLVKPIDIPGYDNLNNVRFVPKDDSPGYYPTRGLVEGQIVLPQNQFLRSLEVIEANPEYSHVELNDEDGDGFIDRFVVRGPKDEKRPKKQNVGLFVDIAKPLKNERLAMENWSLT